MILFMSVVLRRRIPLHVYLPLFPPELVPPPLLLDPPRGEVDPEFPCRGVELFTPEDPRGLELMELLRG
jgi:hypothetical protein